MKLSTPRTSCPSPRRRSVRWEPRNPAAPDTRIRINVVLQLESLPADFLNEATSHSCDDMGCKRTTPPETVLKSLLIRKPKADDREHGLDAILPGDFLSLLVAASIVGHAHLKDAESRADLGDL